MPVTIRPKGEVQLYVEAAKIVGQRERAIKEEERAERISSQLRSFAQQKEMAEFNAQLQLAREKRAATRQVEAEERAYQWTMEKAELASRMDFEKSERDRIRKLERYDRALEILEENQTLPDIPKERAIFDIQMKKLGIEMPARVMYPEAYQTGRPSVLEKYGLTEPSVTSAVGRPPAEQEAVSLPAGQEAYLEIVNSRTGQRGMIPAASQTQAEAQGWRVIRAVTPTTKKELTPEQKAERLAAEKQFMQYFPGL